MVKRKKKTANRSIGYRTGMICSLVITIILLSYKLPGAASGEEFFIQGALYQDFMGFTATDTELYSRASTRLRLSLWNRPGNGWTISLDLRNRTTLGEDGKNQFIIYNAKISYDSQKLPVYFSLGQMNLYDTAGIGQLTGILAGIRLNRSISIGGYGGLEPDIYNSSWDTNYRKFGVYARYLGTRARQVTLSYNQVSFNNEKEREFISLNSLIPIKRIFVFYGSFEYELANGVKAEDRFSWIFANARLNLTRYADITANYSSGRGLDFHRFLEENSQNPTLTNSQIERFFYNKTYAARLSIKPLNKLRLFVEQRESELLDNNLKNHSSRFGLSGSDLLKTGISIYGVFSLNRGDQSESDTFYLSLGRTFGRLSCNLSLANYFNGIRYGSSGVPEIIHLQDHLTLSGSLFYTLNRTLAFSFDYSITTQQDYTEHQFFVRAIYRKR